MCVKVVEILLVFFGNPSIVKGKQKLSRAGRENLGRKTSVHYRRCGHSKLSRLTDEQRGPTDRPEVQPLLGRVNMYAVVANKRSVI